MKPTSTTTAAADLLKLADKSDWLISEWENKILPDGRIPLGLVKGQALEYVKGQFNSIGADLRIISKAIEAQQTDDTLSGLRTQIESSNLKAFLKEFQEAQFAKFKSVEHKELIDVANMAFLLWVKETVDSAKAEGKE